MERAELITHLEHLAEYVKYSEDAPALREVIEMLKCSEMPNSSEERTETHACVLISMADVEQTVEDNILCYTHSERPIDQDPDTECHKAIRTALKMLRKDLRKLPPAQPDHSADVSKMVNGDVVSRREAIDAVNSIDNLDAKARGGICFKLMGLPPAQLESIKCKDCGYAEERGCALFCGFWTRYTAHKGYCFKAERREENHG